jgi:hypothetical protein
MKNKKMIVLLGLAGLIGALYISIPATFIVLLLGLLFIPPIAVIISTIKQGVPVLLKELTIYEKETLIVPS